MGTYDIVLFPWRPLREDRNPIFYKVSSATNTIKISDDIRFEYIPDQKYREIYTGCSPKAREDLEPERQMYSLVRDLDESITENLIKFDADGKLKLCIALSRLVHPTSISFEFSAKIVENDSGNISVFPGYRGDAAYVVDDNNDYLSEKDVKEFIVLYDEYAKRPLKAKLFRALWYHEKASISYEFDVRVVFCVTALEAIIHTKRHKSTAQFVTRIPKLGEELGLSVSPDEAEYFYELRSILVHGQAPSNRDLSIDSTFEELLRLTIMKSILDSQFAERISNEKWIDKNWPI